MAIFYVRTQFLNSSSRNAVHAAAYRRGTVMRDERSGEQYDYRRKHEVAASGLAFPDVPISWVKQLSAVLDEDLISASMWNLVQSSVKRKDAQLAADIVLAWPRELTADEMIGFAKEYAVELSGDGFFVDWALHDQGERGTENHNPHLHIMTTLRPLTEDGFGPKRVPVLDENGAVVRKKSCGRFRIEYTEWAGTIRDWQRREKQVEVLLNKHLALAWIDARVDCRSNAEKANGLERSVHIGAGLRAMKARGEEDLQRFASAEQYAKAERDLVLKDPAKIFDVITEQRATFTKRDTSNQLRRLGFDSRNSRQLAAAAFKSGAVVRLEAQGAGTHALDLRYSTLDMIAAEKAMIVDARGLSETKDHAPAPRHVKAALEQYSFLSGEQKTAVEYLTEAGDLKSLVGLAGTGKTTLLKAANGAWDATGIKVRGVALAGKAAEELKAASGIESSTLASLLYGLKDGRISLDKSEVIVLDEAGMVGSRDMAALIGYVRQAGAKLILTGDPGQLPAISAGAAFRAILENVDPGREVSTIRRQRKAAHRGASQSFGKFDVKAGLAVYDKEGAIHKADSTADAIAQLALRYTKDFVEERDTLAITHRNKDVRTLNATIRRLLKEKDKLTDGMKLTTSNSAGEQHTEDYAVGDRIVFLRNDKKMRVKNGTAAVLEEVSKSRIIARVDDRRIQFDPREYRHFAHGYAVTIYKSQGASVDHVHVLASPFMDRNLTYVAMTRHKQSVQLHYDKTAFKRPLAEQLGRANEKTSTLDLISKDDVAGYGERRGVDSLTFYERLKELTFKRVEGAWKKLSQSQEAPAMSDYCILPKTAYEERPWQVAQRAVQQSKAVRQALVEVRQNLRGVFEKDLEKREAGLMKCILERTDEYDARVGELFKVVEAEYELPAEPRNIFGFVSPVAQKAYDDELQKQQQAAAVRAKKLKTVLLRWRKVAVSTYQNACEEECEFRSVEAKGLKYPSDAIGRFIRQYESLKNDDKAGIRKLEETLEQNPTLCEHVLNFERERAAHQCVHDRKPRARILVQSRMLVTTCISVIGKTAERADKTIRNAVEYTASQTMTM